MNVTSAGSASVGLAASGPGGGDIVRLQKRVQELTTELKSVATSNLDAKAKIAKSKLLQAMIQMLQQQIAAIQQQGLKAQAVQQQNAAPAAQKPALAANAATTTAARKTSGALGAMVDAYA